MEGTASLCKLQPCGIGAWCERWPVAWDFMGMPDNHEYVWSVVHCTGSTFRFPSDVSGDFSGSRVGMCIISISELQKDSADTPGGSTSPGATETGQKVFV